MCRTKWGLSALQPETHNKKKQMDDQISALQVALEKIGFKHGTLPDTCLQINPPSADVEVLIHKVGVTKRPQRLLPDEFGVVELDNLQDDVHYDVEIYNLSCKPQIMLHKFVISKNKDGVDIRSIDTGGTLFNSLFKVKDTAFSGAVVLGDFTDKSGRKYQLNGKTSDDGSFKVVLPPGTLTNFRGVKGEITVPKRGSIQVPEFPPSSIPRLGRSLVIEVDPSSFSAAVDPQSDSAHVVILGDISGSMCGPKVAVLRNSLIQVADKAFSQHWKFALASWDSWVEWFSTSWIDPSENDKAKVWIGQLEARGGNDMRYAIEEAMRKFPSATDVYVMCDGDISPFVATGGKTDVLRDVPRPKAPSDESHSKIYAGTSWVAFRNRFSTTKFHFVALGLGSSADHMQQMAIVGDGSFWESQ